MEESIFYPMNPKLEAMQALVHILNAQHTDMNRIMFLLAKCRMVLGDVSMGVVGIDDLQHDAKILLPELDAMFMGKALCQPAEEKVSG